jgi:hypothetical protein
VIEGLIMIGGGIAAGLFGSLLGLGGGILIVPLLTLGFKLPLLTAVGVSLVCVIVTSGAASGVYLERRVANLRLGMTLELFTAIGALGGAMVAFLIPEQVLSGLFGGLLLYVAATMARGREPSPDESADPKEVESPGSFVASLSGPGYRVRNLRLGAVGSVFAGIVSALLGIGGGTVKVPVMHVLMGVPLRVATATSNLMIGITASSGAIVYLLRGQIDAYVVAPTAVGVFLGASLGSRIAHRIELRVLRLLFVAILLYTAWQMLQRALP